MEASKWKTWFIFLFFNLILLNVGLAFLWQNRRQPTPPPSDKNNSPSYQELETKINQLKDTLAQLQNAPAPTPLDVCPATAGVPTVASGLSNGAKTKTTTYMPVPGSGSVLSYDWVNLSGTEFYFNPADFPGLLEVHFEANMRLFNGNGLAFLRLFDVTNGIEVWGSEVQTGNQASTVIISDKVQFRSGNNLIRVQAKSLTADTTIFTSGRLKITAR